MTLIEKIKIAVESGNLPTWFTTANIKAWITENSITKSDGSPFAQSTINSELSNRDIGNLPTTNLSMKILKSRVNNNGEKGYCFLE